MWDWGDEGRAGRGMGGKEEEGGTRRRGRGGTWRERRIGRGRSEPCLGGPDPGGVLRGPSPSPGARCPHAVGVLNLFSRTRCTQSPCSVCAPICWASG